MSLYRCCLFGKAGLLPGCKPIHADSDRDARRLALELLHETPPAESLDVWRDADFAFGMSRHQMLLESPSLAGDL
jgi:hypothetical protein